MSSHFTSVIAHIVHLYVLLLLGLNAPSQLQVTINVADDIMQRTNKFLCINIVRKLGHLYIEWGPKIYFTEYIV